MGFFSGLKAAVRKSEAAVVIEKLLEHQVANDFIDVNPREAANKLVEQVWDKNPQLFGSGHSTLPNKLALAAAALSRGVRALDGVDRDAQLALATSLGYVLMELAAREGRQSLSALDVYLIGAATSVHSHFSNQPSLATRIPPVVGAAK